MRPELTKTFTWFYLSNLNQRKLFWILSFTWEKVYSRACARRKQLIAEGPQSATSFGHENTGVGWIREGAKRAARNSSIFLDLYLVGGQALFLYLGILTIQWKSKSFTSLCSKSGIYLSSFSSCFLSFESTKAWSFCDSREIFYPRKVVKGLTCA